MTRLFKTTAIAALALSTAMPAFATAHLDVSSMTCEQYNELSGADRDKVAMMALAEISGVSDETIAENNGTATATSTVMAGDDESAMAEKIALLNRTCSRNWDAMVSEAAAGQSGTR